MKFYKFFFSNKKAFHFYTNHWQLQKSSSEENYHQIEFMELSALKQISQETFIQPRSKLSHAFNVASNINLRMKFAGSEDVDLCFGHQRLLSTCLPQIFFFEDTGLAKKLRNSLTLFKDAICEEVTKNKVFRAT